MQLIYINLDIPSFQLGKLMELHFRYIQGQKDQQLSGQFAPEFVYSHCEDPFPYLLSEFALLQSVCIAFCHFTVHLWEESGSTFSIPSH